MRVSVRQSGGSFGIDTTVEVIDNEVTVTDGGATRASSLDGKTAKAVADLASTAKSFRVAAAKGTRYDAMTTALVIEDGASKLEFLLQSGDSAPAELWQLVNLVKAAPATVVKE